MQERYGYLPERALRIISDRMTIHWAQVFGAAGLGGFRLLPAEGHVITVCSCAACRFAGGDDLLAALRDELGIGPGEATADGAFTLETSPEVAAGAMAPARAHRHAGVRAVERRPGPAPGRRSGSARRPRRRPH